MPQLLMALGATDEYKLQCGNRLQATRLALGFLSRRALAEKVGVEEPRLEKWETGANMVPAWFVEILRQRWDVPHDWIFAGIPDNLKHSIATEAQERLSEFLPQGAA